MTWILDFFTEFNKAEIDILGIKKRNKKKVTPKKKSKENEGKDEKKKQGRIIMKRKK